MSSVSESGQHAEALERAARFLAGASTGNTITMDVVIREGRGPRVWDLGGNEYVDYSLGSGPMLLGHAHPEVVAAVTEQIARGSTFFGLNEHAISLAEELVEAVPCAEKVRFTSTGTEATFHAMRVARAYRKRDKILKFEGGYHGMHDYALMSMSPDRPTDFPTAVPDTAGIPSSLQSEVLIAPFNDIESTTDIIERHHDSLAGVIVEPLQRVIPPKPGFLQGLREATREYGVPLIFDEIVTGFRLAYGGAQEYYGVVPDLCTLGKAMAGGLPLAAVAGIQEIMDHFDQKRTLSDGRVLQEGTFNGNPLGAVAALAALKVLRREGTYQKLFATGKKIMEALQRLADEAELPARVVGEPPVFDLFFGEGEFTDYRSTLGADAEKLARFTRLLLQEGVYKSHNKYYISTVHDEDDIEPTVAAMKSALQELGR